MVVASIEQLYTGHAKRVAMALMATGLVSSMVRFVIIVDDDIDPSNISEVLWAVATRCDPVEHIDIIRDYWGQRLDPILSPEKRARLFSGLRLSTAILTHNMLYPQLCQHARPQNSSCSISPHPSRGLGVLPSSSLTLLHLGALAYLTKFPFCWASGHHHNL